MKKKQQNDKRSVSKKPSTAPEPSENPQEPEPSAEPEDKESEAARQLEFDEEMVEQVRTQTSLIEGREVSREETIEMLKRVMRQHSFASERRRDYVVRFLREEEEKKPP